MSRKRKAVEGKMQPVKYTNFWTDREIVDLTYGLQECGFAEIKKIAEIVKTKDENAIKQFLAVESTKLRQRYAKNQEGKRAKSSWNCPDTSDLDNWPNLRKWRRVIHDQHLPCVKKQDYSKILLEDLFRTFYEEAEDTADPEIMNAKAIYKYLLDCVRGFVPAELSPIDSGIVLLMLGQLLEMHTLKNLDFSDEHSFIANFKKAKSFAPFKVKDEFRENSKKRTVALKNAVQSSSTPVTNTTDHFEEVLDAPSCSRDVEVKKEKEDTDDAINVVEELYYKLSRHRKMVQSFNPLNVPLWHIVKEQKCVQHTCDQSSGPVRSPSRRAISKKDST